MLTHLDSKVDPIQTKLSSIQMSLDTLGEHVVSLEQRIGANEDNLQDLSTRINDLTKDNAYLMDKVQDLENCGRASNLRFVGIPESSEGRDVLGFMAQLLLQLFGRENFPESPAIERAHRTPLFRNNDRAGSRPILIKLSNFQDKIKILRLAREKKELVFKGTRIDIYPDFSAEPLKRRRTFDKVKRRLRELNLKYSLRYPCTLSVIVDGKPQLYTCYKTAETAFMSSMDSSL
ncbi:LINE-1 type transposase domain-containing 1 [Labeo rohita]|uniref:LINE-1 type transposase domain-containing 1 n=1 Tax=Labeo rohita TaxID=84645 RepID=A0A498MVV1_LABRO|nr:LINE-1 type transposase domain-containing 1 [Labeo rohita]